MNTRGKTWLLALIVAMGLLMGMVQGADARRLKSPLPPTKTPTSGTFDFTGSITVESASAGVENATIEMTGNGAFSQEAFQMELTIRAPEGTTGSSSNEITFSTVVLDEKFYFKMAGVSPEIDDQWYVADLEDAPPGSTGTLPGMPTSDPTGVEEAFTTTEEGKETINGIPTTKYRIDVDLKKLYVLMGVPERDAAELARNNEMVMFMWVGDMDMYVHRMSLSLESEVPEADLRTSMQFTINYKDLDKPVTITAPPNAQPIDLSSTTSILPGGVPIGMPVGMPVGMPRGTGMGMPRTGAANQVSIPWALVSVGVLMVAAGGVMRRRSYRPAEVSR